MLKRITIEDNKEYLRQISTDIDFKKDDLNKYLKDIKEFCEHSELFALAPVQVGIPKRIIYVRNTSQDMTKNSNSLYNEDIIYINPVIKKMYGHTKFLEGCGSCKFSDDTYITGVLDRPYKIEIEYYDINAQKRMKTIEGFETTVFCHEYDHLNGILHMDRINETYKMTLEEMRIYRTNHPYEIISKDEIFSYDDMFNK